VASKCLKAPPRIVCRSCSASSSACKLAMRLFLSAASTAALSDRSFSTATILASMAALDWSYLDASANCAHTPKEELIASWASWPYITSSICCARCFLMCSRASLAYCNSSAVFDNSFFNAPCAADASSS